MADRGAGRDGTSRVVTPVRHRPTRAVVTGFDYRPADEVPGGVLSPEAQRDLNEKLDAITRWQRRSRASGATYVIDR